MVHVVHLVHEVAVTLKGRGPKVFRVYQTFCEFNVFWQGVAEFATRGTVFSSGNVWWAQQDLNLRPTDYESAALTN